MLLQDRQHSQRRLHPHASISRHTLTHVSTSFTGGTVTIRWTAGVRLPTRKFESLFNCLSGALEQNLSLTQISVLWHGIRSGFACHIPLPNVTLQHGTTAAAAISHHSLASNVTMYVKMSQLRNNRRWTA